MEQDKIEIPKKTVELDKKDFKMKEYSDSESDNDSNSIDLGDNNNVVIGKTPIFDTKDNTLQNINHPIKQVKSRPKSKSSFNLNIASYTRQWRTQQKTEKEHLVYQERFENNSFFKSFLWSAIFPPFLRGKMALLPRVCKKTRTREAAKILRAEDSRLCYNESWQKVLVFKE